MFHFFKGQVRGRPNSIEVKKISEGGMNACILHAHRVKFV